MTDTADTDHGDGRAGAEPRHELPHRVVGGEAGIGVRCDVHRFDPIGQRDERALVDEHEIGEAAVARQPGELVPLAVHVQPAAARHAEAAAVRRVEQHRIADPRRRHAVPGGLHPARVLVPEDDGQRDTRRAHQPVDRMQIGRADACATDPDDDVARSDRLGIRVLDELEPGVVVGEERSLHVARTR